MLLSTTDGAATAATSATALNQKPRLYKTVSLNDIICIELITTERLTPSKPCWTRMPYQVEPYTRLP